MALPKLETPTYKLTIPSTGKSVSYRPFLVKEEKILLMAKESNNEKQTLDTVQKLVSACILDEIDCSLLTSYDLEYIFVMLRSKSVGEEMELLIPCNSCKKGNPYTINIEEDIKVSKPKKKPEKKIAISDTVGVMVREPTLNSLQTINQNDPIEVLVSCIESIYDDKTVYDLKDYSMDEIKDFVGALNIKELGKLREFFENTTKITCDVEFTCECGYENKIRIDSLSDFF